MDDTDVWFLPNELKVENKNAHDWIQDRKIALERSIKSHEYNEVIFDKNRTHQNFKIVDDMLYVENGNYLNRTKLDEP